MAKKGISRKMGKKQKTIREWGRSGEMGIWEGNPYFKKCQRSPR